MHVPRRKLQHLQDPSTLAVHFLINTNYILNDDEDISLAVEQARQDTRKQTPMQNMPQKRIILEHLQTQLLDPSSHCHMGSVVIQPQRLTIDPEQLVHARGEMSDQLLQDQSKLKKNKQQLGLLDLAALGYLQSRGENVDAQEVETYLASSLKIYQGVHVRVGILDVENVHRCEWEQRQQLPSVMEDQSVLLHRQIVRVGAYAPWAAPGSLQHFTEMSEYTGISIFPVHQCVDSIQCGKHHPCGQCGIRHSCTQNDDCMDGIPCNQGYCGGKNTHSFGTHTAYWSPKDITIDTEVQNKNVAMMMSTDPDTMLLHLSRNTNLPTYIQTDNTYLTKDEARTLLHEVGETPEHHLLKNSAYIPTVLYLLLGLILLL